MGSHVTDVVGCLSKAMSDVKLDFAKHVRLVKIPPVGPGEECDSVLLCF